MKSSLENLHYHDAQRKIQELSSHWFDNLGLDNLGLDNLGLDNSESKRRFTVVSNQQKLCAKQGQLKVQSK